MDIEDAQKLSEEESLQKEREWINTWVEKISQSNFDDCAGLKEYKYEIWIEAENCIDESQDITDNNSDVTVKFENGAQFIAAFFTYDNIQSLREKNIKSGECSSGKHFWSRDLIIAYEITRRKIEEVVQHLISTGEFIKVFRCC